MARTVTAFEMGSRCFVCDGELTEEGDKMFVLSCCRSGIHQSCLREKYPGTHLVTCPFCHCLTQVDAQVIKRDEFSPEDSDKIDLCFLKHHAVNTIPMTTKEMEGLRIALNVRGFRAMRHVSRRMFVVGLAFWFPLTKEKLCDWEDIVSRLSLGLIWNMVSEMRHRYALRVERDGGRGDVFHHLVNHLLEVGVVDEGVTSREFVVRTCCGSGGACRECHGFVTVFDGQRFTDHVALANRAYLYDRVGKSMYNQFADMAKKAERKKNTKRC